MVVRFAQKILVVVLMGMLLVGYNNCAPPEAADSGALRFFSGDGCGTPEELFVKTYRGFLNQNCKSCHITGGPEKGAFADEKVDIAWRAFSLAGFAKISEYAVNAGHNSPFTGPHNTAQIEKLSKSWSNGQQEIQRCQAAKNGDSTGGITDGSGIGPRIHTAAKALSSIGVGREATLRWNLGSEIARVDQALLDEGYELPSLQGVTFEITVAQLDVPGQVAYTVSRPRLINNSGSDLRITSLMASINGDPMARQTTFKFTEVDVRRGEGADEVLSHGSLVVLGALSANDTLSVNFGRIDAVTLDPPDLGPMAEFQPAQQRAPGLDAVMEVKVVLSQPPALGKPVFVGLAVEHGNDVKTRNGERFDNYDWDYVVDTLNLNFEPGETQKSIFVRLNDHERAGNDKQITVRLATATNATIGIVSRHVLTIPNDNPMPAPGEVTLSMLMTGNGVLLQRCLECHNNGDRQGGYDMSDYSMMVANGVIIPGNPEESMMMKRIRGTVAPQMPFDQPLTPQERILIEKWIRAGAKNN